MASSVSFDELRTMSADWENCWETILHLPIHPASNNYLFGKAKRIVFICRSQNGYDEWFAWQVQDAKLFVAEQLELDPDSPEWRRIGIVLAGAQAGLSDDP